MNYNYKAEKNDSEIKNPIILLELWEVFVVVPMADSKLSCRTSPTVKIDERLMLIAESRTWRYIQPMVLLPAKHFRNKKYFQVKLEAETDKGVRYREWKA
jgi:hypothetical protein